MDSGTSRPEFFYFDLGNVVVTFDHEIACQQIARLVDRPIDAVRGAIFASGLQHRYELGEVTALEFYEEFCRRTSCRPEPEALLRAGSEIFELNDSVMEIIARMHATGHRLGILSNTCSSHWDYLRNGRFRGLSEYFELAVLSFQVRCGKPDAAIYEHAARRAAVGPERIFFVDDRPENIAGARQCGWDAVLFENADQLRAALRRRGVPVESLSRGS